MIGNHRAIQSLFLILMLGVSLFLQGCEKSKRLQELKDYTSRNFPDSKIMFAMEDPSGDDNGPGDFIYPYNDEIKRGMFDLTGFLVYQTQDHLNFEVEFAYDIATGFADGTTLRQGFVLHNIDIYIDMDRKFNSGITRSLPGRNIQFQPQCAWEKVILVTPEDSRSVERQIQAKSDDLDLIDKRHFISVADDIEIRKNKFLIRVPLSKIGEKPSRDWGYQVVVTKYENVSGPGNFKVSGVKPIPDENHFGGSSTFPGSPNVIDCLLPKAVPQAKLLRNYTTSQMETNRKFAQIPCVYVRQKESP